MFRSIALTIIVLALNAAAGRAAEPIPIGVFLSLSGKVQSEGRQAWQGIRAAHDMKPTVLGRPIVLKTADAQSEAVMGAHAMFRLLARGRVKAVIGDVIVKTTLAGSTFAIDKRVPVVCLSSTDCPAGPAKRMVFGVSTPIHRRARSAADIARNHFKAKTAVIVTDIGQHECLQAAHFFKLWFTRFGGKIVGSARILTRKPDFEHQLSSMERANADIVFAAAFASESVLLAEQARNLGIEAPILTSASEIKESAGSGSGKRIRNVWFIDDLMDDKGQSDIRKSFASQYKAQTGNELGRYGVLGAEAYFSLVQAISRSGRCDSASIRDALARGSYYAQVKRISFFKTRLIPAGR